MSNLSIFGAAEIGTTQEDVNKLLAAGVSKDTLYRGASVVAAVDITLNESEGTWQPTPGGERAFIVPCGERGPHDIGWRHIDDLLAFDLRSPRQWYRRTGVAAVLNSEAIDRAAHFDTPLQIHSTPLAWLIGGGVGVVLLDPGHLQHPATLLCGVRRVLVDSTFQRASLLRELRDWLPEHKLPEIRVNEHGALNAA